MEILTPEKSELGKKAEYESTYNADKLYPISRKAKRAEIGIVDKDELPFSGFDIWNHYEVSWLNEKGKPIVAIAVIIYSADSANIIESKSMKLFFNSLNNTKFESIEKVEALIKNDIKARLNASVVEVFIKPLHLLDDDKLCSRMQGHCLDGLDIECNQYQTDPTSLFTEEEEIEETLYSDLLKSNCLVTNQPDWCSVQISYQGKKINHEGLLRYLVSFRNSNEFHEQCIEKIFMHLMQYCKPTELTVYGRSTRRGGVDINSFRSTKVAVLKDIPNMRLCRQ